MIIKLKIKEFERTILVKGGFDLRFNSLRAKVHIYFNTVNAVIAAQYWKVLKQM